MDKNIYYIKVHIQKKGNTMFMIFMINAKYMLEIL